MRIYFYENIAQNGRRKRKVPDGCPRLAFLLCIKKEKGLDYVLVCSDNCARVGYFNERSIGQMIDILLGRKENLVNIILMKENEEQNSFFCIFILVDFF